MARFDMIDLATAQKQLLALAPQKNAETVPLSHCFGRYLKRDVVAQRSQPLVDLSAMDGYAIRWADMPGPWQLIGENAAGRRFTRCIEQGQAVRIFTGASVPPGADTILVQEDARIVDNIVHLEGAGPPRKAAHIRVTASDFGAGATLLKAGERLTAGKIALAAMAGFGELSVGALPKISYFSTGNELVSPGCEAGPEQIPSSNNPMIAAMLAETPCAFEDCGIVPDRLDAIVAAFEQCTHAGADVIVTSGGVSVGDYDLVQPALRKAGAKIEFWKIAMKPGKPVLVARLGNSIILGLPGNPSSAYVTAFLLLLPLAAYLAGSNDPMPHSFDAELSSETEPTGERAEFVRAIFDGYRVHVFNKQDSGLVSILAKANALIIRPKNSPALKPGARVTAYRITA